MKKRITRIRIASVGLLAGLLSASVPIFNIALAMAITLTMAVNNTSGTSYVSVPFSIDTHNNALITAGNLLPSGLDSRVLNASGTSLPRMLADDNTWFVGDSPAHVSSGFSFTTGNTPSSTMPIITGSSGNVSTADAPDLELDRHFDVSISGYFNTSVNGTSESILYKQGAAKLNVSAVNTITFHALNADDSDNWTMSGAAAPGIHTVRIYADGLTAYLYVDAVNVATHALFTSNLSIVNGTTNTIGHYYEARYTFYAAGLYWDFYPLSGEMKYSTSADGSTWSAAANITASGGNIATNGAFSIWFDGTKMSYAAIGSTNTHFTYRRGTPLSTGNFTWDAAEQDVNAGAANILQNITIAHGTDNVDQVATEWFTGGISNTVKIFKNNNTDGTWATAGGYPITVVSDATNVGSPGLTASFTDGKMYFVRQDTSNHYAFGRVYNGSVWGGSDETLVASNTAIISQAFGNSGEVYLVYQLSNVIYMKVRASDASLSAPITIATLTGYAPPSVSYDPVDNSAYIFYMNPTDGDMYYVHYIDGTVTSPSKLAVADYNNTYNTPNASVRSFTDHISISHRYNSQAQFVYLTFPWEWNDTVNAWWWATNNTMPYTDNISLSVQAVQKMFYAPNNMIYGSALPDRSALGTHTGTIYWGTSTLTVSGAALLTLPATNITTNSAMLNGQLLDMAGMASYTAYFDYGLTTAYGNTVSFGVMAAPGLLSANATGLFSGTTYHFRAVAVSTNITLYGGDLTFTTSGQPGGGSFQFGGGNARVFKNYITANDTLITAEIVNTYVPYYPNQSPKEYFTVQLISTDNSTILAATPQQDWGDKPIGIYLNPTQSATITDGAGYYVRVQANFASNVSVQYQLQNVPWANDWKGSDLTKLDDWAIYVALDMQTFYSGSGYVTVLTDRKLAITDAVGGYFTAGIAGIGQIRPNLFTTSQQSPVFSSGISALPTDNLTAYTAYVGSNIATDAAVIATPFGLTARDVLAGIICLAMLGVIMTGTSMMGGFGALGLFLISIPFLWLGTYFKIIGVQWVMILTIIFGFFAVRQFIIKTT